MARYLSQQRHGERVLCRIIDLLTQLRDLGGVSGEDRGHALDLVGRDAVGECSSEAGADTLHAAVVEITFTEGTFVPVRIAVTGAGQQHKVYFDQPIDIDQAACRSLRDGDRTIADPLLNGAKAYVLMANTSIGGDAQTFEVTVGGM